MNETGRPECPVCGDVMPPGCSLETHNQYYCNGDG